MGVCSILLLLLSVQERLFVGFELKYKLKFCVLFIIMKFLRCENTHTIATRMLTHTLTHAHSHHHSKEVLIKSYISGREDKLSFVWFEISILFCQFFSSLLLLFFLPSVNLYTIRNQKYVVAVAAVAVVVVVCNFFLPKRN